MNDYTTPTPEEVAQASSVLAKYAYHSTIKALSKKGWLTYDEDGGCFEVAKSTFEDIADAELSDNVGQKVFDELNKILHTNDNPNLRLG